MLRTIQLQKPVRLHPRALSRPVSPSQSHSPLPPTVHGREESASGSSGLEHALFLTRPRKVDVKLHGKGNSNCHGARPVHTIISMLQWIRTSRLSTKNSLSLAGHERARRGGRRPCGSEALSRCPAGCEPYASYPEYSRANSYPWSPFPPRRARSGPGPHSEPHAIFLFLSVILEPCVDPQTLAETRREIYLLTTYCSESTLSS